MASRASNFCIDAADPYTQTRWWAQVLDDFVIDPEYDADPDARRTVCVARTTGSCCS